MNPRLLTAALLCLGLAAAAAASEGRFRPPPGAKIIYQCDFDDGQDGGWDGELTAENALPGSKFALKVGGGRKWTSRRANVPVSDQTVLSFYVRTADSPWLIVQCFDLKRRENCKSYWYLYPNRDHGRWVHVRLPLTGTLVDCASNHAWTAQPGDTLANIQIHIPQGKTILLDELVVYDLDAAGKLVQARTELTDLGAELEALAKLTAIADMGELAGRLSPRRRRLLAENERLSAKADLTWAEASGHYDKVANFRRRVERLRDYYVKAEQAFGGPVQFAIGTEHPMVRISDEHWMYPFAGQVSGAVKLSSARNEYESFQAVILPLTGDLKGVDVKFSDLEQVSGGEGVIPAGNLSWRIQPYVQLLPCHGYQGYDYVAPKPDPLLPGEPFDLPAHRFKPLWVTLYTPPGVPHGDYAGTMTVTCANARPHSLRIWLRVWDYDIPRPGRFRCQTHMNMEPATKFYGRSFDQAWRREWYEFLLKYRFSPTQQYATAFTPHPDDIEFCKARGCNVWILGGLSGKEEVPVEEFRKRYEIARKHDILRYCHVYIGDETSKFDLMRRKANVIHANFPGLKVMIGGSRPRRELIGYIDIWDPIIDTNPLYGFSPDELEKAQQRGEEVMWYVAAAPQHPYPNVHMGDPLFASRMLFWLTWKYRITGFEYYCFGIWGRNVGIRPRWPASPWHCHSFDHTNGDGQLCYPGPDGHPAASVRLENIRDGIEDWEALYLLEGAVELLKRLIAAGEMDADKTAVLCGWEGTFGDLVKAADAALAIDDSFCKDVTHWSLDPAGLRRRRDEVSKMIEAIVGAVGKEDFAAFQSRRVLARRALEDKRLEENRQRALKELKAE